MPLSDWAAMWMDDLPGTTLAEYLMVGWKG